MERNDIEIKSLAGISADEVTAAFLAAFADYGLQLDDKSLWDMLKRRGARMDMSFAAISGGKVVSFIINGIGEYGGKQTAYDTGTGTVKEMRGLGLTDRIFNHAASCLRKAGIERYLLEVLTDNVAALKIYKRQGFEVLRELDCFTAATDRTILNLEPMANTAVRIATVSVEEVANHADFFDFAPSWQNSLESIRRHPEAFTVLAAYDERENPIGIGGSETAYGDVTLLAVDKRMRRNGVGSRLLLELLRENRLSMAKVLNIWHGCAEMSAFLMRAGFTLSCRQYEMVKPL